MRITMTYELARACSMDAANRNMRKNGRKAWNKEDYGIACKELNRLWPVNSELREYVPK
jgi:hypothetical protein